MLSLIKTMAILACVSFAAAMPVVDGIEHRPNTVVKRASGTLTALVTATPASGVLEYFSPIKIEGVTYNVLLDTGSVDLWIKGTGSGKPFTASYGSGNVSGTWTYGTVVVGGMTLTDQPYGQASSYSSSYDKYDGILGISPLTKQFNGAAPSWLSNIMPNLAKQEFAVNLASTGGTVSFGYDESAHEATKPFYTPLSSSSAWRLNVDSFGVSTGDTSKSCLLDTGTTNTYVPQSVADAYWKQVVNSTTTDHRKWQFPCSSKVPDLVLQINSHSVTIPGYANVYKFSDTDCRSRLQARDANDCTLGQGLFYGQYTIFNYGDKTIGLSDRK